MKFSSKRHIFRRRGHQHKVRLFWLVLRAFVLVIVLSICGMFAFVGLIASSGRNHSSFEQHMHSLPTAYTDALADFYVARGNSWRGVERRLEELESISPFGFPTIVIIDANGRVVASQDQRLPAGRTVSNGMLRRGMPVRVDNQQVGTLLLREPGLASERRGPPEFFWPMLRTLLGAGVVLALILLLLATALARHLSRPLREVTTAAQTVAAGDLNVHVPGASVRELDDLAASFNRMAQSLAEADRQRRQMTADVAHELRTPLTIVKGRLEGLQDGVYQATPAQVGRLLDEVALLERLIDDLRTLALAEAGQLPLYPEQIEPTTLLEDAAAVFAAQAVDQDVRLSVEAAPDLPPINVDPQRMSQVLANLITNALRYTPAAGSVTLCGEHDRSPAGSGGVVLRVRDTGKGIAPEELPQIFDRFWRADRSRTRSSGGTGLGLAIARQIVVAHGGTIQAESAPGIGTTITIRLPVAAASPSSLPA